MSIYRNRQKKVSGFTKYNSVELDDRSSGLKDGGNATWPIQAVIDKVAEVFGGSFRVYEFESELIASDIQLGEYVLVEENNYRFYKVTNIAPTGSDISLDSGYTAEYVEAIGSKTFATVAAMTAASPIAGMTAETQGYTTAGDGGGATYMIVPSQAADGYCDHVLANGNIAVLKNNVGNILQYGGGASVDDSARCQAAIDAVNKLHIPQNVTVYALSVAVKDDTILRIQGTLKMPAASPDWSSVLVNADTTNGNGNVTIDFTGGVFDGNRANQVGSIHHIPALFINCWGFDVFGGTYGKNYAPETAPSAHPLGPFDKGVNYGEASFSYPIIGMITFHGGRNNHIHDFDLIDWAQEGVSTRWNEGSSITDFRAVNGVESNEIYYAPVDFGSRAGSVTVAINDQVLVQEGHTFGGVEQQPHLIYKALVAGTYDLDAEDYTDSGRWTLVIRDISLDLGYTSARHGGACGAMNSITNGYAAFCRGSSFSNDGLMVGMNNLYSYHNSYQVGINFGHANSGGDASVSSNLTAINSGWAGGVAGSGFGINIGGGSRDVQIANFYICGAARNGVNQSDLATGTRLSQGFVKFSTAGGIKSSSPYMTCTSVRSMLNGGDDFEPSGTAVIKLVSCEDSRGILLNNEKMMAPAAGFKAGQTQTTVYGFSGLKRQVMATGFACAASSPIVTIKSGDIISTALITATYLQRNSGSSAVGSQYAARETVLASGTGSGRGFSILDTAFTQGRQFRYLWITDYELHIYLQDNAPADVAVGGDNISIVVEVQAGTTMCDIDVGV